MCEMVKVKFEKICFLQLKPKLDEDPFKVSRLKYFTPVILPPPTLVNQKPSPFLTIHLRLQCHPTTLNNQESTEPKTSEKTHHRRPTSIKIATKPIRPREQSHGKHLPY